MSDWAKQAISLAEQGDLSWRKIAKKIGVPKSTVSDKLRKHFSETLIEEKSGERGEGDEWEEWMGLVTQDNTSRSVVGLTKKAKGYRLKDKIGYDNSRILLISDLHIPYHHKDAIAFLSHLKAKYKPTRVICLGDELDKHALSYHDSDPDLKSAGDELRESLPIIAELYKMFPVMEIIESNHGSLVWRKAKTHGIPRHYIKSYNDVLGVGEGWTWHPDLVVDLPDGNRCYIHHGKSNNVVRLSQQMGMSAVQGHYHEILSASYWGNPNGLHWGLQAGCLIDDESYAFSYNNVNLKRPVIGTALIINSLPVLEPLVMGEDGRWVGA